MFTSSGVPKSTSEWPLFLGLCCQVSGSLHMVFETRNSVPWVSCTFLVLRGPFGLRDQKLGQCFWAYLSLLSVNSSSPAPIISGLCWEHSVIDWETTIHMGMKLCSRRPFTAFTRINITCCDVVKY